jgi:hypothetical protein
MATSAFGKAFRAARESGDTEFEYEGKKYNTKLKEEDSGSSKSSTRAARPASTETRVEPKQTGTPDLPVTKSESPSESKPEKKTGIGPYNAFSGVGDYLNKTFTMEGREQVKKENKEKYNMKKGGSVSSRADGIAQRGKTRGKMC